MWISHREYVRLLAAQEAARQLKNEVDRLAALISEPVTDCKLGPWCKDCKHYGTDASHIVVQTMTDWIESECGRVVYCKKHLHETCPEYEMKG